MTKDEALKMAIEALEVAYDKEDDGYNALMYMKMLEALNACKEALEQPEQEPVEVYGILDDGDYVSVEATKEGAIKQCEFMNKHDCNCTYKPLYTNPHQWQGLTELEQWNLINKSDIPADYDHELLAIARAIEQALKEKNHGI